MPAFPPKYFLNPIGFDSSTLAATWGFPQSNVQCIAQDSIGFLWFGTEDGLNRYDGYRCTVYRHDPADSSSISDSYIWRLLKSRTGDLWIGTLNGGLNRYEMSTGKFVRYQRDPNDSTSLSNDNVTGLFEDRDGTLWVGTWGGGLCRLDRGSRAFVRYRHDAADPNSLSGNFVSSIKEDADGDLWIGTWRGLSKLDHARTHFTQFAHSLRDPGSLSNDMIWDLYLDSNNDLWIATRDGLNRLDRRTGHFHRFISGRHKIGSQSSNAVSCMREDRWSNLWVGTYGGGVRRLDRERGVFIDSPREINASDPSVRSDVLAIQEDRSGAIWFGTSDGIWWYDPRADRFHPYGSTPDNPRGITHVRSMCESSSGEIWVGSNGAGLVRFDRHTTRVTRYRTLDSDLSSLSSDHVLCVLEQRDGTVWVGTEGHGLNRLRPGTRHFDRFLHDPTNPRSPFGQYRDRPPGRPSRESLGGRKMAEGWTDLILLAMHFCRISFPPPRGQSAGTGSGPCSKTILESFGSGRGRGGSTSMIRRRITSKPSSTVRRTRPA